MKPDAKTQLNLVIGDPLGHTQSPALHQKFYDELGINAVMLAVENPKLKDLIDSIKTLKIGLTAVTLPFKTAIIEEVDHLSEEVQALQAANTLILKNEKITAYNTDITGIQETLKGFNLAQSSVLVLGAGGAARACGYVLSKQSAKIFWCNRTVSKAEALADQFTGEVLNPHALEQAHFDLIINTTSVGLAPNINESPLPDYSFKPNQTVFDLIYTPTETRLLREAKQAGAQTINGETMFKAQALKQIELWRDSLELHNH